MKIAIVNIALVETKRAVKVLNLCKNRLPEADAFLLGPENPSATAEGPTLFGNFVRLPYLPKEAISYCVLSIPLFIGPGYDFVILVQNDGFILHAQNWRWHFLDFDFIGPLWPTNYPGGQRVGCGGFSLRSRKLMQLCLKHLPKFPQNIPAPHSGEDFWIASVMRNEFEAEGARYATPEVASLWGIETKTPDILHGDEACFGFHKFNTPEREKYREQIA